MLPLPQTLIVPAIISLILFLVLTYGLLPLWRRYRNRYSNYLPVESVDSATALHRLRRFLKRIFLPERYRLSDHERLILSLRPEEGEGEGEGEELGAVTDEQRMAATREEVRGPDRPDDTRRLSRE